MQGLYDRDTVTYIWRYSKYESETQKTYAKSTEENFGYAVGIRENRIISVPLAEAVSTRDCFDDKLYDLNSVMAKF